MNIEEINTPDLNVFKPNSKNTLITTDEFFELWNKRNKYDKLEQALNEIREYANSDKLLTRLCEPKINDKGETHFDLIKDDILQIIDATLGGSDECRKI